MAQRVRWTSTAYGDLQAIADYIARDSPAYAAGVVRRIRDAVRTLPRFPLRGRMVPEFEDPAIRELIVGNYRLIYNPTEDLIYILAIIHGARDLPALWRREGRQPPLPLEEEE